MRKCSLKALKSEDLMHHRLTRVIDNALLDVAEKVDSIFFSAQKLINSCSD